MGLEATLFAILFAMIFFVLGVFYKIIAEFKKEMVSKYLRLHEKLVGHTHTEKGVVFAQRK